MPTVGIIRGATVIAEVTSSDVPDDEGELAERVDADVGVVSDSKRHARRKIREKRKEETS